MAMYTCDNCNELKDDDWSPCSDTKTMDWVCEDCLPEVEEEEDEQTS